MQNAKSNKRVERAPRIQSKTNSQKEMEEWVSKGERVGVDDDLLRQSNEQSSLSMNKEATIINSYLQRQIW